MYNYQNLRSLLFLSIMLGLGFDAKAHGENPALNERINELDEIDVMANRNRQAAEKTASEAIVTGREFEQRPLTRAGDLLEFVPGMIATQHSGSGKANQYFFRGFNLDHATDFATFVEDMPINIRSHGHGQGYTDLNFLIPEMIGSLQYKKGPYDAEAGDFSAAGSAYFGIRDDLDSPQLELGLGSFGFRRGLILGGVQAQDLQLNYGAEAQNYDGPWRDIKEQVGKRSAIVKASGQIDQWQYRATLMAYDNSWNSPDQVPLRAVQSGLIDAFGSIDSDLGGKSSRYSFSTGMAGPLLGTTQSPGWFDASIYLIDYDLDLFSNFTYLLDNPVEGDEFRQFDHRQTLGAKLGQSWFSERWQSRIGADFQVDLIDSVGLAQTASRRTLRTVRDDQVRGASSSLWADAEYAVNAQTRAVFGLRYDRYNIDVSASRCPDASGTTLQEPLIANCLNFGKRQQHLWSPKASFIVDLSPRASLYLSAGRSFHSNDARGAVTLVDPLSGASTEPVELLVPADGAELGFKFMPNEKHQTTLALWTLSLDSELRYVGDAGGTEASLASRRQGIEWTWHYHPNERWQANLETSYTKTRFVGAESGFAHIPGSLPLTIGANLFHQLTNDMTVSLHARHFGSYPLSEDNAVRANSSTLLNLRMSKKWSQVTTTLDVLNLLDSNDRDIEYFYTSRLPGEPTEGVEDRHFHILEPRAVRLSVSYQF